MDTILVPTPTSLIYIYICTMILFPRTHGCTDSSVSDW